MVQISTKQQLKDCKLKPQSHISSLRWVMIMVKLLYPVASLRKLKMMNLTSCLPEVRPTLKSSQKYSMLNGKRRMIPKMFSINIMPNNIAQDYLHEVDTTSLTQIRI